MINTATMRERIAQPGHFMSINEQYKVLDEIDNLRNDNKRESEISYERLVELDNLRWKVSVLEGMLTALGHGESVALMHPQPEQDTSHWDRHDV